MLNQINIKSIRNKGFFNLLSANILIQLFAFASQLFVAGILSPDDMGRIKLIQTYLSIFSIVAGLGISGSTLKLCSENRTEKEQFSIFKSGFIFSIITTVSLYFLILILNYFELFSSDHLLQCLIPIGLFPVISNSLFMVFVSYIQATKKMKLVSNLTIINKVLSIVSIIIFTYFMGIKGYYFAYNLSFILMLTFCFKLFSVKLLAKEFFRIKKSQFLIHWQFAKQSLFANLLSEMAAYVDILLIGFFVKDMQQIGYYSFALTMTVLLRLFPNTVQQITCPYFSSLAYKKIDFTKTFIRYNKILYSVVIFTLLVVLIISPTLIHWIFNGKYDASMIYFPILALGWSLRQLVQLQSAAIFGLGKIKYNAYISLITLISNTLITSLSLYYYGAIGAAYASVLSGTIFLTSSIFYFKKALRESFK
jgi:O-antigen/teichoic acid export membrane protein